MRLSQVAESPCTLSLVTVTMEKSGWSVIIAEIVEIKSGEGDICKDG